MQHRAEGQVVPEEGVNKLVADLFTLPVATVRRAKTKQKKEKTENRERKQKTENETKTKTTEKLCEKGGKMQALFSLLRGNCAASRA